MKAFYKSALFSVAAAAGLAVFVGLGGASKPVYAQRNAQAQNDDIEVLQLRPNFYMINGAGGNISVELGDDGVVLVDSGTADMSGRVLAEIKKLSSKPIRYIFDTSADPDHVGGNEALSQAGHSLFVIPAPVGAGGNANNLTENLTSGSGATILAYDRVLDRMSEAEGSRPAYADKAWPTITYPGGTSTESKQWAGYVNGEGIQLFHEAAAHSDADSIVLFRRSDVLATGEIFNTERFPVIDVAHGGSIQGEINALNHVIDLTITELPMIWQEYGTLVVPGHGRVCDQADVLEYRDMVTIVRDIVQDGISKGQSLDQIKAANPTQGYRARYGSDTGPWTTDMFVEAVYRSLTSSKDQTTKSAKN